MLKGKSLKRASKTKDAMRIYNDDISLIVDTTELITPQIAEKILRNNKNNRPINWNKVEEYESLMKKGEWKFHAQGIILDKNDNVLTGQKRLWAIVLSGISQHMRISRGSLPDTAQFIDRGTAQSSRDLAARKTERKHSPTEGSIARALLALEGNIKPSVDTIAEVMVNKSNIFLILIKETKGIKKTKSILMILGAICFLADNYEKWKGSLGYIEELAGELDQSLFPMESKKCWNRGAAFNLAMEKAKAICEDNLNK